MKKTKIIAVFCAATLIFPVFCVHAEHSETDLKEAVRDAIEWKNEYDDPLYDAGSANSNLYITALKRLGESYNYSEYLSSLEGVAAAYNSESLASDMQKTAIAAVCAGGSAQYIAGRDLIADSTYYRDATAPLDREGVGGLAWALIALDSGNYQTPDWAKRDRNSIIAGILSHQNTDGSFDDNVYDTACAVTALAPYCATSGAYTITQNQTGWSFDLSPRDAVESALDYLSDAQLRDGDWGDMKSTAMTVIALDAMDIDADSDRRFVAGNGSAIDGLMDYQSRDGGFSADLNKSDGEATSYALCALASHLRKIQDKSTLFSLSVNDTVTLTTPTSQPQSSTARPAATARATATARPAATVRPSSTRRPTSTAKPSKTMQPTKTAAPKPSTSPRPSISPRPTRRPDLVGPMQMPGPMQPTPTPEIDEDVNETTPAQKAARTAAVSGCTAVAALAAIIALIALKNAGKLKLPSRNKSETDVTYKAKHHRKTEEHRRFEQHEKYKQRMKFDKRRK